MIKFDKDVLQALKTLEKAGFKSYAAGDCIRYGMAGMQAYDWDLITLAQAADLERLFPQGEFINENRDTMRVNYTFEAETENGETYLDGAVLDIHVLHHAVDACVVRRKQKVLIRRFIWVNHF